MPLRRPEEFTHHEAQLEGIKIHYVREGRGRYAEAPGAGARAVHHRVCAAQQQPVSKRTRERERAGAARTARDHLLVLRADGRRRGPLLRAVRVVTGALEGVLHSDDTRHMRSALSAQIPAEDHQRMAAALAEQGAD